MKRQVTASNGTTARIGNPYTRVIAEMVLWTPFLFANGSDFGSMVSHGRAMASMIASQTSRFFLSLKEKSSSSSSIERGKGVESVGYRVSSTFFRLNGKLGTVPTGNWRFRGTI
jgi:hypothetical protein